MLAALAGCLYAHHNAFVSPESFDFLVSTMLVVMVALGGTGNWWGAFLGALIYTLLPELLRSFGDLELLVYGVSLVVVLLFFPRGLGGALDLLCERIASRFRARESNIHAAGAAANRARPPIPIAADRATGFSFVAATPAALDGAIQRAIAAYADAPRWRGLMLRAMAQDFSWRGAAQKYMALYQGLLQ